MKTFQSVVPPFFQGIQSNTDGSFLLNFGPSAYLANHLRGGGHLNLKGLICVSPADRWGMYSQVLAGEVGAFKF